MSLAAAGIAAVATLVPAAIAVADPSPVQGPSSGGTTVTGAVPTGDAFTAAGGGIFTGYALGADGGAYAWGENGNGQLGDGTNTDSNLPVQIAAGGVPGGVRFTAITGGGFTGYALGSDGNVYAWGGGGNGQLGNGTNADSNLPVQVTAGGMTFTAIAAGGSTGYALGSDGNVYAWGGGGNGQLGNGTNTDSNLPVQVTAGGMTFTAVAAGSSSAYALGSDGNVYAWGIGGDGQLGNGTNANSNVPLQISAGAIPGGVTFTAISGASNAGYALGSDGHVYAWGYGGNGQLGNGGNTSSNIPVQVMDGAVPSGVTITAIAASGYTGYALGSDGHGYAWGLNDDGQLGDGTNTSADVPVQVAAGAMPSGVTVTAIAGSFGSGYAIGSDGRAYAWGTGGNGQLGDGTNADSNLPVQVQNGVVVTGVSFAGVAGTGLTQTGDSWSVRTPPAANGVCGSVEVDVTWTQHGADHSDAYPGGFSYVDPGSGPCGTLASTGTDAVPTIVGASAALLLSASLLVGAALRRRRNA